MYRNKGIGSKLIDAVMAEAQRAELESLSFKPVIRGALGYLDRNRRDSCEFKDWSKI